MADSLNLSYFADEGAREIAFQFSEGRISAKEFVARVRPTPEQARSFAVDLLDRATAAKSRDALGIVLSLFWRTDVSADYSDAMVTLLAEDWQDLHEDLVELIGRTRDPRTAAVLERWSSNEMKHWQLAIPRKCVWALGALETIPAVEALARVWSGAASEEARSEAKQQLERLADDVGVTGDVRSAARLALQKASLQG